jgi:hypothetical protein
MLYREIIAVCSQIHTKHINTLCGQNVELLNITQEHPTEPQSPVPVTSEFHIKHINTLCGQNVDFYFNTHLVPRRKHNPSRLEKPVS